MKKKIVWISVLAILAVACLDEPDCFDLNNNVLGISFRKIRGGVADTINVIDATMVGTDSVFYSLTSTTGLYFPLNIQEDISEMILHWFDPYNQERWDTLIVDYRSRPQFISDKCGERFVIADLKVAKNTYDSARVVVRDAFPYQKRGTNVMLHRCPRTDLMRVVFRQLTTNLIDTLGTKTAVDINGVSMDYAINPYLYNEARNNVTLALNRNSNSTTFTFDFPSGTNSLTMGYQTQEATVYEMCGPQKLVSDLSILSHDFDRTQVEIYYDSIYDPPVTNVHMLSCPSTHFIKVDFRSSLTTGSTISKNVTKIVPAFYEDEILYEDPVRSVVLPLDTTANSSVYTVEFESVSRDFEVQYVRTWETIHEVCGQYMISSLQVVPLDFTAAAVVEDETQYPLVTNVQLVE